MTSLPHDARAQSTRYWNGSSGVGLWNWNNNWWGSAPTSGDRVEFEDNDTPLVTTNNTGLNIGQVIFTSGATSARTINGGINLTDWSGNVGKIENNSSGTHTINDGVVLNGGNVAYEINPVSGNLVINGGVTANNSGKAINFYGGNTVTINDGIVGAAANPITLQAASGDVKVILNGTSTYTGNTAIDRGTLTIGGSISSSSMVFLGNGGNANNATLVLSNTSTFGNALAINTGDGSRTVQKVGANAQTMSGVITNNKASTFNVTDSGGALTASGIISGSGSINKTGSGTLILSGASSNSVSGGMTVSAGTLILSKSAGVNAVGSGNITIDSGANILTTAANQTASQLITVNGVFDLQGHNQQFALAGGSTGILRLGSGTFTNTNTGNETFSGKIEGSGNIVKTGLGTFNLTSTTSDFTGSVTINGGFLTINNDRALGAVPGSATGGKIVIGNAQLGVSATTTINANRGMTLTSANSTIDAFGGATVTYNGVIAGSGTHGLSKSGSGTLVLGGNSTFTGATTVSNGVIRMTHASALGSGSVTVNNTTALELANNISVGSKALSLNGTGIGDGGVLRNVSGNNSWAGNITLAGNARINADSGSFLGLSGTVAAGTDTLYVGGAGNITISNALSGSKTTGDGALFKNGAGTLSLLGDNSSLGGNIQLRAGALEIQNANALGTGGTVYLGTASETTAARLIVDQTTTRSGTFSIQNASTGGVIEVADTKAFTITGALNQENGTSVSTRFEKAGAGTLILAGTDSGYAGQIRISDGTLVAGTAGSLGSNLSTDNRAVDLGLDLNAAAAAKNVALLISNGVTLGQSIYVGPNSSGGSDYTRTIGVAGAAATMTNNMYLGGDVTFDITGTSLLTFTNSQSTGMVTGDAGTGIVKTGSGTLVLGGGSFTGGVRVEGGLIGANRTATFGDGGTITFAGGGIAAFGASRTIANNMVAENDFTLGGLGSTITLSGTLNMGGSARTVTVNNNKATLNGVISNGGLTKAGSAELELGAANTYTGATVVENGTLSLSGSGRLSDSTAVTVSGGALDFNTISDTVGSFAITGGTFRDGTLTAASYILSGGTIDSTGALGGGTLTNTASTTLNGTAAATTIDVTGGTLTLGSASRLTGTTPAVSVSSGANLALGGNETIGSLAGAGTVTLGTGRTLTVGGANTSTTFSGLLTGSSVLTKNGTGVLSLSGANAYTGGTLISAGTLSLGAGGATGTLSTGNITNNATFLVNRTGDITVANAISGTGVLNKAGAGTLLLSGNNSYAGATTISNGAVRVGNANALGTTAAGTTVVANAALELSGGITTAAEALSLNGTGIGTAGALRSISGNNTFAGAITLGGATRINADADTLTLSGGVSGAQNLTIGGAGNTTVSSIIGTSSGALTKDGAGVLTLSAGNTYTGGTLISAGTLSLGAGGATGTLSTGNITNNATFLVNRTGDITVGNTISGTGVLNKVGAGTLLLSGNSSYSGATTISNGVVRVGNANALGSTAAGTTVASGAALEMSGGVTTAAEALSLTGTGIDTAGALRNISGNNTFAGAITLGGATRINSDADTLTLSGGIGGTQNLTFGGAGNTTASGAIGTSTGTLTKDGAGVLTLSAANTLSGAVTLSAGTLRVGDNSALGTGSVALNAGTFASDSGTARTITNVTTVGGNVAFGQGSGGTGALVFSNGGVTLATGAARTLTLNQNVTILSLTNNSTAGLIKDGAGTLTIGGAGSGQTGGTGSFTINAGEMRLANGSGNAVRGALTINSGASVVLDVSDTIENSVAVAVDGGTLDLGGNDDTIGTLLLTNSGTVSNGDIDSSATFTAVSGTISANMTSLGAFVKTNAGTTVLSGTNTYTVATTVAGGTLALTNGAAIADTAAVSLSDVAGAILDVRGSETIGSLQGGGSTGGNVTISNAAVLTVAETGAQTFAGAISGAGGLTKSGAGTMTLSANQSYTGATTINSGTLSYGGTNTNTAVTINSGGTLAGTGSVGVTTVNSGGVIAPGNSPGTLTVDELVLEGGGSYAWEINNVSGTPGTDWDLIVVGDGTGTVTVNANSGNPFIIDIIGNPTGWDPASNYSWNIIDWGTATGFSASSFTVSTTNFTGTTPTGSWLFSDSGGFLVLTYTNLAGTPTYSGGSGTWSTNFSPGLTTGLDAVFDGAGGGSATNDIASGTLGEIGSLIFDAAAGSYTLSADTGSAGAAGGTALLVSGNITNESTAAQTINLLLEFDAATTLDASAGDMTFGGAISNVGGITATGAENTFFNGVISESGSFTKTGAGTATLSAANTFTGAVTVGAGELALTNGSALADTAAVTLSNIAGATLAVNSSETIGSLAGGGSTGGTVVLGANDLTLASNASTTYGGAITGTGTLIKQGTGTLTFDRASAYGTDFDLRLEGGVLDLNRNNDPLSGILGANNFVEMAGGALRLSGDAGSDTDLSFGGLQIFGGTSALEINRTSGSTGHSSTITGPIVFKEAGTLAINDVGTQTSTTIDFNSTTHSLEANAVMNVGSDVTVEINAIGQSGGSYSFTKLGAGALVFDQANTYTGATIVGEGTLSMGLAGADISASSGLVVSNGATFDVNDFSDTIKGLTGAGTVDLGSGTLTVSNTTADTFSGVVTGTGSLTKSGAGTLVVSGANDFSGGSTLSAGVLRVNNTSGLGTGTLTQTDGTSTLQVNAGGTIANNMSVFNVEFVNGGNTLSGTITNNNTTYDVNAGETNTLSGYVTGSGTVTLIGGGVLDITGTTNDYTGNTVISNGTIRISTLADSNTVSSIGVSNNVTLAGANATNAVLDYTGGNVSTDRTFVMNDGGGTINMASSTTEMTLTGSASGAGTLIVGEGTLVLSNASVSNSFAPASIQVDSGATLELAANNQIGDSTGLILNGGTFRVGTASTGFSDTLGTLTLTTDSTIDLGAWSTGVRQLTFADSNSDTTSVTWSGTLTITNWQGVAQQSSDVAEILFGVGGLSSSQLSQVYWANQGITGGELIGGGELVPVPEPRVYAAAVALLAAVGWRERKRLLGLIRRKRS